jgi:hypothetical protein
VREITHHASHIGQDSLHAPHPHSIPSAENARDILLVLLYKGIHGVVLLMAILGWFLMSPEQRHFYPNRRSSNSL